MIERTTLVEIDEIHFFNTFECFWFKSVFDLRNYEFLGLQVFNITYSFYVVKNV